MQCLIVLLIMAKVTAVFNSFNFREIKNYRKSGKIDASGRIILVSKPLEYISLRTE